MKKKCFITQSGSISQLGKTDLEIATSLLSDEKFFTDISQDFTEYVLPNHFAGVLPHFRNHSAQQTQDQFKNFKFTLIDDLLKSVAKKSTFDLVIFCESGSSSIVCHQDTDPQKIYPNTDYLISKTDFLNYFAQREIKAKKYLQIFNTCSSGATAISAAKNFIQSEKADSVLILSYEVTNHVISHFVGLAAIGVLNTKATHIDEAHLSFSQNRNGFVKADAMSFLVLESEERTVSSQKKCLAEVCGAAISSDCYKVTDGIEDGTLIEKTILSALKDADIQPEDIDYINAHGSATFLNDLIELRALDRIYDKADGPRFLSSSKTQLGHALSAASLTEVDFVMKMFKGNFIAGNISKNLEVNIPSGIMIPQKSITETPIKYCLKNSFGFGGYNASLVLKNVTT